MFGWRKNQVYVLHDPEHDRKIRLQRKVIAVTVLVSIALLILPIIQQSKQRWYAMRAASKLVSFLSSIRTKAILRQRPLEVRFTAPQRLDVYEVSSCGPGAKQTKVSDASLEDFAPSIQFVRVQTSEPIFKRYCYDPIYGSSVVADGFIRGSVFLAHQKMIETASVDQMVQIFIEGASGNLDFD